MPTVQILGADVPTYYIHVPRTAGTSYCRMLGERAKLVSPKIDHLSAVALREMGLLRDGAAKCFGVVRNPWDRFVSMFYHVHGKALFPDSDHVMAFGANFADVMKYFRLPKYKAFTMLCDPTTGEQIAKVYEFEEFLRRGSLPHVNAGPNRNGRHFAEFFTDEQRDAVGEGAQWEIDLMGYSCE